jgi:hypothetical protein
MKKEAEDAKSKMRSRLSGLLKTTDGVGIILALFGMILQLIQTIINILLFFQVSPDVFDKLKPLITFVNLLLPWAFYIALLALAIIVIFRSENLTRGTQKFIYIVIILGITFFIVRIQILHEQTIDQQKVLRGLQIDLRKTQENISGMQSTQEANLDNLYKTQSEQEKIAEWQKEEIENIQNSQEDQINELDKLLTQVPELKSTLEYEGATQPVETAQSSDGRKVFMNETFDDNSRGWYSDPRIWGQYKSGTLSIEKVDSESFLGYELECEPDNEEYICADDLPFPINRFGDFFINFSLYVESVGIPEDGFYGIRFRGNSRNEFYLFLFDIHGNYRFIYVDEDGAYKDLFEDRTKYTGQINRGMGKENMNNIEIGIQGNRFTLSINDVEVETVFDNRVTGPGKIFFYIQAKGENRIKIKVDEVNVSVQE